MSGPSTVLSTTPGRAFTTFAAICEEALRDTSGAFEGGCMLLSPRAIGQFAASPSLKKPPPLEPLRRAASARARAARDDLDRHPRGAPTPGARLQVPHLAGAT